MKERKVIHIPIGDCQPAHDNPKRGNIDELAQSIQQNGVLSPILVRGASKPFEIVFGHRRWEACRIDLAVCMKQAKDERRDKRAAKQFTKQPKTKPQQKE